MSSKIRSYFGFNSARYEVAKDEWEGISLEMYYHKNHTHTCAYDDEWIEKYKR